MHAGLCSGKGGCIFMTDPAQYGVLTRQPCDATHVCFQAGPSAPHDFLAAQGFTALRGLGVIDQSVRSSTRDCLVICNLYAAPRLFHPNGGMDL